MAAETFSDPLLYRRVPRLCLRTDGDSRRRSSRLPATVTENVVRTTFIVGEHVENAAIFLF
jgi:hypothetical protein